MNVATRPIRQPSVKVRFSDAAQYDLQTVLLSLAAVDLSRAKLTSRGTIIAWTEDPSWPECLNSIRVRWDSGQTIDHAAAECALFRCPPDAPPPATKVLPAPKPATPPARPRRRKPPKKT